MKKTKANNNRTSGKSGTKVTRRSYTPISDAVSQPQTFADSELADGIGRHGLVRLLQASMSRKRRKDGEPLGNILAALLAWPLLKTASIHCFCCELCQFLEGRKRQAAANGRSRSPRGGLHNILYSMLGREDVNWRKQATSLSLGVVRANDLGSVDKRAFVFDDSLKKRRGKRVEGTSKHFDHNESRVVQGHQVLEMGMAGEKGFLPLDRQIYMGKIDPVDKPEGKEFRDKRSAAARDMKRGRDEDKNTMLRRMLRWALKEGHRAQFVLADAWFGNKRNIETVREEGLTAIFQMKRGEMNYLLESPQGRASGYYTAKQIYELFKRKMKPASKKAIYKTCRVRAWVNLETNDKKPERWEQVILVLSAPVRQAGDKESWVIFLCTDVTMSASRVLEAYSLRWSIEVYFKEIKQNFGFLAEQSGRYQVAYASVHLAAMRYTLIFEAMLRSGALSYGEIRDKQTGKLQVLCYAGLLWELFRAIIDGALDVLKESIGSSTVHTVQQAINEAVESFLNRALQMEPDQIRAQLKAEAAGLM